MRPCRQGDGGAQSMGADFGPGSRSWGQASPCLATPLLPSSLPSFPRLSLRVPLARLLPPSPPPSFPPSLPPSLPLCPLSAHPLHSTVLRPTCQCVCVRARMEAFGIQASHCMLPQIVQPVLFVLACSVCLAALPSVQWLKHTQNSLSDSSSAMDLTRCSTSSFNLRQYIVGESWPVAGCVPVMIMGAIESLVRSIDPSHSLPSSSDTGTYIGFHEPTTHPESPASRIATYSESRDRNTAVSRPAVSRHNHTLYIVRRNRWQCSSRHLKTGQDESICTLCIPGAALAAAGKGAALPSARCLAACCLTARACRKGPRGTIAAR